MLHGYKKSRYNIYDNLEFLGLNPYEQKHFCFGEGGGEGSGESGATVDPLDSTSLSTDPPQLDAQQAADAVAAADAARDAVGGLSPEGYQAALDVASANVGGYNLGDFEDAVSQAAPSSDELDALEETGLLGYNDKAALGYLDTVAREQRESDLATARGIEGLYGLREGDVTPAPVGGFSYQGPGSTRAALSEIGKGAIDAGSLFAEGYMNLPGPGMFLSALGLTDFNKAGKAIGEAAGLRDLNQTGFVEGQIGKGFAESIKDQLTSWGRGEAPPTTSEQASSIDRSQPQSSTDYFDAPQTLSQQVAAAPEAYDPAIGMADPNIAGLPGVSFPGHISTLGIANTVSPEAYEAYHNAMFDLRDLKGYEFGPEYGLSPTANMGLQPVGAATPEQAPSSV